MSSAIDCGERPAVLMLAAGISSRFGSDKRCSVLQDQETLLYKSLQCFRRSGLRVFLCLSDREEDGQLAHTFSAPDVVCLRCDRAHLGMGATLAQGVQRCSGVPGVFVALADMPLLSPETISALEVMLAPERIVFPLHRGRRGHPVLFGAGFFSELLALNGDQGAASLLRQHTDRCVAVAVDDPGVLLDADTPAALATLSRMLQRRSSSGVSGCDEG